MDNANLKALADILSGLKNEIQKAELKKEELENPLKALSDLKKTIENYDNLQKMGELASPGTSGSMPGSSSGMGVGGGIQSPGTSISPSMSKQEKFSSSCKSCKSMFKTALEFVKSRPSGLCKMCSDKKSIVPEIQGQTTEIQKASLSILPPKPGGFPSEEGLDKANPLKLPKPGASHYAPAPVVGAPAHPPKATKSIKDFLGNNKVSSLPIQANTPKIPKPIKTDGINPNSSPNPGTVTGTVASKL